LITNLAGAEAGAGAEGAGADKQAEETEEDLLSMMNLTIRIHN
jgi:hypothetical protein